MSSKKSKKDEAPKEVTEKLSKIVLGQDSLSNVNFD